MTSDLNARRRVRQAEIADLVNARRRARYLDRREIILHAMRIDRVTCPLCGRNVRRLYLSAHQSKHNCVSYQMKSNP